MNDKKPKFILEASLAKIVRIGFCKFNQNLMMTLASDESFSIFNYMKRDLYNNPSFIQKYKTYKIPNWIESTCENKILVADKSEYLSIYTV